MKIKKILKPLTWLIPIILIALFFYHKNTEDNLVGVMPYNYTNHINDARECFPKGSFDNIHINYINIHSDNMTWATRPSITSLFRSRKDRVYLVQKSNHPDMCWLFDQLSYDAQVGIIVHELCHILEYENKSRFEIIGFGYEYQFNDSFKKTVEQRTDRLAKKYGERYWLDWKSSKCSLDTIENSDIVKNYWSKQDKYYLTVNCEK